VPRIRSGVVSTAIGLLTSAKAQNTSLPDMGSSAALLLSPEQEAEYGAYTLYQLRNYGYILDDPLLDGWLRYYPPDVLPDVWTGLDELIKGGDLGATEEVLIELEKRDDGIHKWAKKRKRMFARSTSVFRKRCPRS